MSRSRSHISNTLRLLTLPSDVIAMLEEGTLTSGQARPLIGISNASSIAEITGIPRATVIRKLKYASKFGLLTRDKNQLYVIKKLSSAKMREFTKIASTIQERTYKFIGTFFELYKNKAQLPKAK